MTTVWKGQLTFGLVNIPVRLYRAARKERVPLHYVARSAAPGATAEKPEHHARDNEADSEFEPPAVVPQKGPKSSGAPATIVPQREPEPFPPVERVEQTMVSANDQRAISRKDLLKGYEAAPDHYVTLRNEELRALRPATSTRMEIVRSVPVAEIDPVYLETSYYVVPDRGGERAYSLLFAALRQTEHAALARVAMHGREHIVVIRAGQKGLIGHTMYYVDEVKAENEYQANTGELTAKEIDLAKTFVNAISGAFALQEFKDAYKESLEKLIAGKASRGAIAGITTAPPPTTAPVIDIVEALKKSLSLQRKPAASERKSPQSAGIAEIDRKVRTRKA